MIWDTFWTSIFIICCSEVEWWAHAKLRILFFSYFLRIFKKILFTFRERGREGEREGETTSVWEVHELVFPHVPPTGDLAYSLSICPDQESNWWPFGSQAGVHSTEPHHTGWEFISSCQSSWSSHCFQMQNIRHVWSCIGQLRGLSVLNFWLWPDDLERKCTADTCSMTGIRNRFPGVTHVFLQQLLTEASYMLSAALGSGGLVC